jgi:tRNA (mo5U34)-methyltransferase
MNYLSYLPKSPYHDAIAAEHMAKQKWINQNKKGFLRYREPCNFLSSFKADYIDCSSDVVTIGTAEEIEIEDRSLIEKNLRAFMPWRKGPFSIFDIDIDAEWRSERKWKRLLPALPNLKGKVIADIGCSNGYYMFRMASYEPKLVLGLEPSMQHYYCFQALNSMAGFTNLHADLLGVEHIGLFPDTFDVIFLMGIIYHRSSPVDVLKDICTALKPGGTLILESQAIPGDEPIALFPEKTYAKVPGTYFVPTGKCLQNWIQRAGLQEVELFCSHPMSEEEQRKTDWMVFESYNDFINPADKSLTVEGYAAPHRIFLSARK